MPYFENNKVNLLFIHIPKTGGKSLENYLSKKYSIRLNRESIYGRYKKSVFPTIEFKDFSNDVVLHHLPYKIRLLYKKLFSYEFY